jgi:thioredoxin-related protein
MRITQQRLEATANVLIIVVAILLGTVLIQKYLFSKNPTYSNQSIRVQPVIGSRMNLAGINWANRPKTLIFALQTGCPFCIESASFYKRIIASVQNKNIQLIAVFPSSKEESTAHLNELGLTNLEVKQSPLDSLQVSGTPTLILTNDKGEITNYWVGRLTPDKEVEVISHL